MKQIVILKNKSALKNIDCLVYGSFDINGLSRNIPIALIEVPDIEFNIQSLDNAYKVLIHVHSVSSNYRDIALINLFYTFLQKEMNPSFICFGSEFVGTIIKVGKKVKNFKMGDKVIPNCSYPLKNKSKRVSPGIPTNHSFSEMLVMDFLNLIKIPNEVPNKIAAGLGITAMTGYSMLEKMNIKKRESNKKVLIMGIKSNTSALILNALKKYNLSIWGTSSNTKFEKELKYAGLKELIITRDYKNEIFFDQPLIQDVLKKGGFDYVFDPFADVNYVKCIELISKNGKYVTCGVYFQAGKVLSLEVTSKLFAKIIANNIQVFGNCLGNVKHVNQAINDFLSNDVQIPVFNNFDFQDFKKFIKLSYCSNVKPFGKIMFNFE